MYDKQAFKHGLYEFENRFNERTKDFIDRTADVLDERISAKMEGSSLEAPILTGEPKEYTWYRIPIKDGMAADGTPYHIYLRTGTVSKLCLFFSGGGLAWNDFTASHPTTGGPLLSRRPNYYYNNLRPVTQLLNIGAGIMENSERNPFYDWNFVVITYATGDFHIGENDYVYADEVGNEQTLHFHGYANFHAALSCTKQFFPMIEQLLIGGDSAGGFAVPALAEEIADVYYPDCHDITLLTDASLLCYNDWQHTIKDLWKADPDKYTCIDQDNLTYVWYRKLLENNPGRFHCLYCGSIHDYVLSTYYNDINHRIFATDAKVQDIFHTQLSQMVYDLIALDPSFHFMIHNLKKPLTRGTIHTAVRRIWFYTPTQGTTIATWLHEALNGNPINVGLELLKPRTMLLNTRSKQEEK